MRSVTAGKNDAGLRLDKFITKLCPALPKNLLYKYIRLKRVKINGKKAILSDRLCEGDTIDLYIGDEFFKKASPRYEFMNAPAALEIVYEDENILLADKRQGLLVHPDRNEYGDTLIFRIQRYLFEKGEYNPQAENAFKPALANRIDRNTGGIVIAAKNAEALRILCEKIKQREIEKKYLAVVHGIPSKPAATLEGFLEKNQAQNKVYLKREKTDSALTIRTKYRVLESKNGLSLLEIDLLTGRTHQIRAHMASIGHPLLGDGKYGKIAADKKLGFQKQALYSYSLQFDFRTDAGILQYLHGRRFAVNGVWFAQQLFPETARRLFPANGG